MEIEKKDSDLSVPESFLIIIYFIQTVFYSKSSESAIFFLASSMTFALTGGGASS